MKKLLIVIILLISSKTYSQSNAGSTGLSFLKLGIGAREIALSEAVSAQAFSPFSIVYNPALLLVNYISSVGFMHNEWIKDVRTELLAGSFDLFGQPFFISLNSTNVAEIQIRTRPGESEGTFNAHYFAANLSSAIKINEQISVGAGLKYLYENIFSNEASGYGFDFGFHYKNLFDLINVGVAARNIGSMSKLNLESTKLPAELRIGFSSNDGFVLSNFNFIPSFEIQKIFSTDGLPLLFGLETIYNDLIALRFGFRTGKELNNFSTGLGVNWKGIHIDYAFVPFNQNFGSANIISLFIEL